eukprot:s4384_g11.t1
MDTEFSCIFLTGSRRLQRLPTLKEHPRTSHQSQSALRPSQGGQGATCKLPAPPFIRSSALWLSRQCNRQQWSAGPPEAKIQE